MKRRAAALLAALFTLFSLCAFAQEESTLSPAQQAAAATQLYGGSTSISWALFDEGEITMSGTLDAGGMPSDSMPLYGVGSVSKVYTAAAAMSLVQEGRLDLDEPVVTYLPEFTMADARFRDITMRMLLNHSCLLYTSDAADE